MSFLQEFMPAAVGFVGVACREKTEVIWGLVKKASQILVIMDGGGTQRQSWRRGSFAESRHSANTEAGRPALCLEEAEFWQCWCSVASGISCPEEGLPHVSPLPGCQRRLGSHRAAEDMAPRGGPREQTRHSSLRSPAARRPKLVSYSNKSRHLYDHVGLYEI